MLLVFALSGFGSLWVGMLGSASGLRDWLMK
jgi:hypothetical protein